MKKIILILIIYLQLCGLSAYAEVDKQPVIDLLMQLRTAYSKVDSFTAKMHLERFYPDSAEQNQMVWFKRPQYIKLRQLGPYKEGAQLTIKPNGEIRGHLGGFLSFLVVSLGKDDKNLLGVTDDSALQTDFDVILDMALNLVKQMKDYQISHVTENRINYTVLDTYYDNTISRYRLTIDDELMMIVGLERYNAKGLLHRIKWTNLQLNTPINLKEFDL